MYTRKNFWTFISLVIVIHVVKNKSEVHPDYPLELRMMSLDSELQPDSAESTYVRAIVWNTMPSREHLQPHFDKFDLLQLEEERLVNGKFDIIRKNESTYERFLYVHYPEHQSTVTVFIKNDLRGKKNPFSWKHFTEKINQVLKKYDLIENYETEHEQIDSNHSPLPTIEFLLVVLIISPLFIYFKFIPLDAVWLLRDDWWQIWHRINDYLHPKHSQPIENSRSNEMKPNIGIVSVLDVKKMCHNCGGKKRKLEEEYIAAGTISINDKEKNRYYHTQCAAFGEFNDYEHGTLTEEQRRQFFYCLSKNK